MWKGRNKKTLADTRGKAAVVGFKMCSGSRRGSHLPLSLSIVWIFHWKCCLFSPCLSRWHIYVNAVTIEAWTEWWMVLESSNCSNLWATAVSLINMSVWGNKKDRNIQGRANWAADIKEGLWFITAAGFWHGSHFKWDKEGAVSRWSIQSCMFRNKFSHGAVKLQPLISPFLWTSRDHFLHMLSRLPCSANPTGWSCLLVRLKQTGITTQWPSVYLANIALVMLQAPQGRAYQRHSGERSD